MMFAQLQPVSRSVPQIILPFLFRRLFIVILVVAFCCPWAAHTQTIDFEAFPNGNPTTDNQSISIEFQAPPFGVSFRMSDGSSPRIAKVGSPITAFQGPDSTDSILCGVRNTRDDMPETGQDVGCSFLTDDGKIGPSPGSLLVDYVAGVKQASGELLDIDAREKWAVRARNNSQQEIATIVLCSPLISDPDCEPGAVTGDGIATAWAFDLQEEIWQLEFEFVGTGKNVGLAFDNFSPSETAPCDSICCLGPCCLKDAGCLETTSDYCTRAGGVFHGEGLLCELGRCIIEDHCFPTSRQDCLARDGKYIGSEACPVDVSL